MMQDQPQMLQPMFVPMQLVPSAGGGFAPASIPSMDEFLALKSQMLALQARVEQIEKQLEDEDSATEVP